MQSQQPAPAGPSSADAQNSVVSESEAETAAASEDLAEDEDPGLSPRAWTVIKICNRRDTVLRGVDEYLVRWARTRHPTAEFRISTRRGQLRVKVGSKRWKIVSHVETRPLRQDEEPETVVEWANTWHPIWELSSAFAAIVEYETRHPRLEKQLTMKAKPDLRDWPLLLGKWYDPEEELEIDHGDNRIKGDNFEIEEGVDYTLSLLGYFKRLLREVGKLPSPAIAPLLCTPIRQRLIFRPGYVRENGTLSGGVKMWRILPVYVVGLAHRQPCRNCASGGDGLPFTKCVSWGGFFADACVNCVVAGSAYSTICDCRIGPWSWKNSLPEPDFEADAQSAQSSSSGSGRHESMSARSSVESDDDDGYTPASEQGSPSHSEGQVGGPNGSEQGHATGDIPPFPRMPSSRHSALPGSRCRGNSTGDQHRDPLQQLSGGDDSPSHVSSNPRDQASGVYSSMADLNVSNADISIFQNGPGRINAGGRSFQSTHGRFGPWSPHSSTAENNPPDHNTSPGNGNSFDDRPSVNDHSSLSDTAQNEAAVEPKTIENQSSSNRQLGKRRAPSHRGALIHHPESKRPCPGDAASSTRAFKCEPTSSVDGTSASKLADIDVSHHTTCSRNSQDPCVHPEVGAPPRRPYNKFEPPPGVVYAHDHKWEVGSLDDDNVEFIMSFCPCKVTQYLQDAWKMLLEANPANKGLSRYAVLSRVYTYELNKFIQAHCPGRPQRPGEFIEID